MEEYISGAQYHVDTVVQNGTVVFQALGRYLDPPLSICEGKPQGTVTRRHNRTPAEKRILRDCTKLIQHMGMKDGVTHAEFYLTPKGHVVFGEIAARVGGGPIDFLYQRAYGINLHQAFVAATLLPGYQPKIKDGPELGAEMFLARDDFDRIEGFANAFSQNNPFKTLTAWKG